MVLIIHPMQQFSPAAVQGTVILLGIRRLRVTLLTDPELNGLGPVLGRLRSRVEPVTSVIRKTRPTRRIIRNLQGKTAGIRFQRAKGFAETFLALGLFRSGVEALVCFPIPAARVKSCPVVLMKLSL
jgi:hypothetical protein